MLIDFTFGNFRSFKDNATLSLVAASKLQPDPELDKGNVFTAPERPDLSLLYVAAIYGANASGKSNIALALNAFCIAVTQSANIGFVFFESRFMFDTTSREDPLFFEITFILDHIQYRYGFAIKPGTSPEISSEWLYRAASAREAVLFERSGSHIEKKRGFTEGTALLKANELRRKDALFLSMAAQLGGDISTTLVDYIGRRIKIVSGVEDNTLRRYTRDCLEKGQYQDKILCLMQESDTGISSIHIVEEDKINLQTGELGEAAEEQQQTMRHIIDTMRIQAEHSVFDPEGRRVDAVRLPMVLVESQGTQKLFAFAGPIFDTLANGYVLFVDEMDAKFHPLMTKSLIRLFQSTEVNPKGAQLIFITHDTNLLDRRSFRRDQIWFVEKDRFGASHLYSLAEFKGVRKETSFESDYIAGRFGAIPLLGDLTRLFGDKANATNIAANETIRNDEP